MHELPSRRNDTIRHKLTVFHGTAENAKRSNLYIDCWAPVEGEAPSIREVWVDVEKTGSDERAYVGCIFRQTSKLLQMGCPLDEAMASLLDVKTSTSGVVVGHHKVRFSSSYMDAVAKYILAFAEELNEKDSVTEILREGVVVV